MGLIGRIEIRRMTEEDLDEVMEIERASCPTPWTRGNFSAQTKNPYASTFVVVEVPTGGVLGYLCLWLIERESHIVNFAVSPNRRRQGIGSLLLRHGLDFCREKGVQEIMLEARRSNSKSLPLYDKFNFKAQGVRQRYFPDGEDAVIMALPL